MMDDFGKLVQDTNALIFDMQRVGMISPWIFSTDTDGITTVRNANTGEVRDPTKKELKWLQDPYRFEG